MLRIDRAVVDQLARAGSAADVVDLVQDAVRLEFATIPPYLTAMMSLKPNQNRDVWWAIHDVVVDEMLHMLIGCNLLNALGARPALDAENFLPEYPGPLPLGIGSGLVVGLEPFSIPLLENVFMEIEEPEHPLTFPTAFAAVDTARFATIGEFYRTLSSTILALPDPVLPGDPARQVVAPNWYPAERLFSILTTADAARGIELIIEEGEGTSVSPIDPDGDVAHYYRFAAIVKDHRLVRDDSDPNGFSYTGDLYPAAHRAAAMCRRQSRSSRRGHGHHVRAQARRAEAGRTAGGEERRSDRPERRPGVRPRADQRMMRTQTGPLPAQTLVTERYVFSGGRGRSGLRRARLRRHGVQLVLRFQRHRHRLCHGLTRWRRREAPHASGDLVAGGPDP